MTLISGGPKLRKWYGAPDLLPKDGSGVDEEDERQGAAFVSFSFRSFWSLQYVLRLGR